MTDNLISFCKTATEMREDFDDVWFARAPTAEVASVMHEGAYESMDATMQTAVHLAAAVVADVI